MCTCGGYTAQALFIDFCLCLLKVVSVAVCTCCGYTAQVLLIDFCLCLLKVVSVAVCTCGGYTAQAVLINFCLCLLKVVSVALCNVVGVCTGCDVLTARAYSALLSKWCFSTSSFGGDVKLSVREYVILLLVIPLKRDF